MDNNLEIAPKMASLDITAVQPMTTTTATTLPSSADAIDTRDAQRTTTNKTSITMRQQDILSKLDLSPATLEALKTLSAISSNDGIGKLSNCDKLTASLEQLRAKKNINLFEKLDKIKQEFSGMNHKVSQMETSIMDMRKDTNKLVSSLPNSKSDQKQQSSKLATSPNTKQTISPASSRAGK